MKIPVAKLCKEVKMSRQNYYKTHRVRQRNKVDEDFIVEVVRAERVIQPRLGGRKVLHRLQRIFEDENLQIGRDRFFEILRDRDLLVPPLPRSAQTTNSNHSLPLYPNHIKNLTATGPNQIWVSDITYIRTLNGFLYLSLITDLFSHKIVGYHLGENLQTSETIKALEMALKNKPKNAFPIHHSDRGCQYCSHQYVKLLKKHGLSISMTETNHCAENALAERVNGILKQEYWLGTTFLTKAEVKKAVEQAIQLYNTLRPHTALGFKTPEQIHNRAA